MCSAPGSITHPEEEFREIFGTSQPIGAEVALKGGCFQLLSPPILHNTPLPVTTVILLTHKSSAIS